MTAATRSGWLDSLVEGYDRDPDYVAEAVALQLIEEAIELMEEEGITRSELAEQMGVSRQRVSQMFNAPPNLTLRSMAQLAIALGSRPHASLLPKCPLRENYAVMRMGQQTDMETARIAPAAASGWTERDLAEASA